jgi:hypothetical protein
MKNLELLMLFGFILFISACTNQDSKANKKTKLEGDFVFKNKTILKDSSDNLKSSEFKDKSGEVRDCNEKLRDKSGKLKVDRGNLEYRKGENLIVKNKGEKLKPKNQLLVNDPVKVPEKWSNAYSNDPKWMELYEETSNVFLMGWSNEFQRNPSARISKDELLFAYRRRMEKIFYETPSFIEFSVNELRNSDRFKNFITDFQPNIQ